MSQMAIKRVAIVGAGPSGLTAIKCCIDEGLIPVCFERTSALGGLWRYTPHSKDGQGSVMRSTVINTIKEMMSYSDFPIPAEFPIYMHNTQVLKYFQMYAEHFNLMKYIRFETEIENVAPSSDFSKTGQWNVTWKKVSSESSTTDIFDAVMICTGHHVSAHVPDFPGISNFKGKVMHSHDYKDFRGFEDKRVVVVGIGNSGGDIAVELSRVSSQAFLGTRQGTWIFNRVSDNGMPLDMNLVTRLIQDLISKIPDWIVNRWIERRLNMRMDHEAYGLKPTYSVRSQHPMVNDDLPNRIISGGVKIKADVRMFTESAVEFVDGTKEDNIDAVFLATGYVLGFPCIDKSVIDIQENKVDLFKFMFPPDLEKQTLCVIGCFQAGGALMPLSEMQSRLFARVIKGEVQLPSREEMWRGVRARQKANSARYAKSPRHTIQADYIDLMDQLAELNGCLPEIGKMLFTDPKLALACYSGPCTAYQYRLSGTHTWQGAREAILTAWDRTLYALKTRPVPKSESGLFIHLLRLSVVVLIIALAWRYFI